MPEKLETEPRKFHPVSTRLSPHEATQLQQLAVKQERSVAYLVRRAVRSYIEAHAGSR